MKLPERKVERKGPQVLRKGRVMGDQSGAFRQVLGHFATGVTIVTGSDPAGNPVGLTANSMASVSLAPPLVLVCLERGSASLAAIVATRRFGVSILLNHQEPIARRFSTEVHGERFRDLECRKSAGGVPFLSDSLAWVECALWQGIEAGDHTILVGEVVDFGADKGGSPLLFFRGEYGTIEP
jgi:flavin reductase (DIM6/NTAB) family NADH-FMN oxidoreductase RutF